MHINIYSTHNQVPASTLKDKNVVIIDVLRATSVIVTALANGAKKVMTTDSQVKALAIKEKDFNILLGGERNAVKIDGFDFGNSPLEYANDKVEGKTVLLSTTNGTQAVKKASGAKKMIAASFLNLSSIVEYLKKDTEDFNIICSGTNGNFSLDDGLCAGLILHELRKLKSVSTSDFGELLALPFKNNSFSIPGLLNSSHHFNYLKNKGFSADVDYCLQINQIDLIPTWDGNGFIAAKA